MKELKEKLLKELSQFLSHEGFTSLPGGDSFVKENGSIRKKIFADIITRLDRIVVLFELRVKSQPIEDIKNKTREKSREDSETILLTAQYLISINASNIDAL